VFIVRPPDGEDSFDVSMAITVDGGRVVRERGDRLGAMLPGQLAFAALGLQAVANTLRTVELADRLVHAALGARLRLLDTAALMAGERRTAIGHAKCLHRRISEHSFSAAEQAIGP
jgi:hypothetical protein